VVLSKEEIQNILSRLRYRKYQVSGVDLCLWVALEGRGLSEGKGC